jgi:hypothetical protein
MKRGGLKSISITLKGLGKMSEIISIDVADPEQAERNIKILEELYQEYGKRLTAHAKAVVDITDHRAELHRIIETGKRRLSRQRHDSALLHLAPPLQIQMA